MVERQKYNIDGFAVRPTSKAPVSRSNYQSAQFVRPVAQAPVQRLGQKNNTPQVRQAPATHNHQAHQNTATQPQKLVQNTATTDNKKHKRALNWPGYKSYALITAAFTMIVVGSFLTYQGFKGNQSVAVQAKVLAESAAQNEDDKPVDNGNYDETEPPKDMSTYKVAADMPRFLSIPDVGVMARIKRVGTNADNVINAPKNVFDVGWYEGSSKPGESGVIFLDGHVSGPTKGGIFWNLKKIETGDTITIERGDGQKFKFKVAAKELFEANAVDMTKVLSPYDKTKKGLNIMTCNGKFNVKTQTYDKRFVVYAVAE